MSIKTALAKLDDQHLKCRDLLHHFEVVGFFYADGLVRRQLVCRNCTAEGIDTWSPTGLRFPRRYKLPANYKIQGEGPVPKQLVRQEVLARVTVHASHEDMLASLFKRKK